MTLQSDSVTLIFM